MDRLKNNMEVSRLLREILMLTKQARNKIFESSGVTASQGMVMGMLGHNGKMKISELSGKLGLSDSTVSGIIDRMEKQDIVERIRSEEDRRVVYVSLSEKFKECHSDALMRADEFFSNIINSATPEDTNKIIEGLTTLKKLLQKYEDKI